MERYIATRDAADGQPWTEAMRQYRGFDGIAWPGDTIREIALNDGLAPLHQLPLLLPYYYGGRDLTDLVYCAFDGYVDLPQFDFVGYDVGYYDSEYSHFSAVLNDVVFGQVPLLTKFRTELNDALLFIDEITCSMFLAVRSGVNDHVETNDSEMCTVPMYALRRAP